MPSEQENNQAQNEQEETKYYWAREYRLLFPTINLEYNNLENKEGLAVEFEVNKDLTQETNKAKFTI
jgi:hypothetical protein